MNSPKIKVSLALDATWKTRDGVRSPIVKVLSRCPDGDEGPAYHRIERAALRRFAAEVDLRTPVGEGWGVVVDVEWMRVRLELITASERENAAGADVLRLVIAAVEAAGGML